mmetsp:Transcript_23233/g.59165  ORF Transcript_23233/g.59165 Transcript_23233/m.59165 type:complete len:245 (-) Transcript_23233:54-788(-)
MQASGLFHPPTVAGADGHQWLVQVLLHERIWWWGCRLYFAWCCWCRRRRHTLGCVASTGPCIVDPGPHSPVRGGLSRMLPRNSLSVDLSLRIRSAGSSHERGLLRGGRVVRAVLHVLVDRPADTIDVGLDLRVDLFEVPALGPLRVHVILDDLGGLHCIADDLCQQLLHLLRRHALHPSWSLVCRHCCDSILQHPRCSSGGPPAQCSNIHEAHAAGAHHGLCQAALWPSAQCTRARVARTRIFV